MNPLMSLSTSLHIQYYNYHKIMLFFFITRSVMFGAFVQIITHLMDEVFVL